MKIQLTHKAASFLSIAIILMTGVIGPVVFVFIIDPFQIYHSSFFKEAKYSKEQSYQHAGWINQLLANPEKNYQGIVIGASTMANYTQTQINKHLPWGNTMNLSVNGSTPWMQHSIAKYALEKNPHIKHILWDVHLYYERIPDSAPTEKAELKFPHYLYNNKIQDDSAYLFNMTNIETGLNFLSNDFSEFSAGIEDNGPFYEVLLAQGKFLAYNSRENKINNLQSQLINIDRSLPSDLSYADQTFPSIDQYMLDVLLPLCNSDTDIVITFSPATRFSYAILADIHYLYRQIFMRRYVVEQTQNCKNIKVFAFDNEDWIVNDLGNYADSFHYQIKINDYIMESIAKNEHRLTVDNIDQYETRFIFNIKNYNHIFLADLGKP